MLLDVVAVLDTTQLLNSLYAKRLRTHDHVLDPVNNPPVCGY